MKRRRVILILAGLIVAGLVAFMVWPGEREPEYQGKKLSEWLGVCNSGQRWDGWEDSPQLREAVVAVAQIGTNAIPFLLKWIRYERPVLRDRLFQRAIRTRFLRGPRTLKLLLGGVEIRSELAGTGFAVLGPTASSAAPELIELMHGSGSMTACRATFALGALGKVALAPLTTVFTNQTLSVLPRLWAGRSMAAEPPVNLAQWQREMSTSASPFVPAIVRAMADRDSRVTEVAALILGEWGAEPNLAVPALTNCLKHSSSLVRGNAVWSLERFGNRATSAVSSLVNALNDPDSYVRERANSTLREIAPEVLQTNAVSGR